MKMELDLNIKSEIEIKDEDFNSIGKECDWNHCSSSNSKESETAATSGRRDLFHVFIKEEKFETTEEVPNEIESQECLENSEVRRTIKYVSRT
ncbi:UNVERIFIED_CONTAM: hypothetical protein RMT77_015247 [Armadillidium vulgare]